MLSKAAAAAGAIAQWYNGMDLTNLPNLPSFGVDPQAPIIKETIGQDGKKMVGAYFPNWSQYRPAPYKYSPDKLKPLVPTLTHIYYGFMFFCPPKDVEQPYWVTEAGYCKDKQEYDLIGAEPKDAEFLKTMTGWKAEHPDLKIIGSIGGWNFPSEFFSKAVRDTTSRQKFVDATIAYCAANKLDGIEIDWEHPCSAPRMNPVQISCDKFQHVKDKGGHCDTAKYEHGVCTGNCDDKQNLLLWVQELHKKAPQLQISIAAAASPTIMKKAFDVAALSKELHHWNLMTYDYYVSDIKSANITAPNQNLYSVDGPGFENQWSTSDTVKAYKEAGADPSQLWLGLAFYGHHWYVPDLQGDDWKKFGLKAAMPFGGQEHNECCGDFKGTYGVKGGKGCHQCGSMMHSEIMAAGFETTYDEASGSNIGYLKEDSQDGYTKAGTWISFIDKDAIKKQTQWAMDQGMGGAFSFDASMDTVDFATGEFTYELTHEFADIVNNVNKKNGY